MNYSTLAIVLALSGIASSSSWAQAPADSPAGTTGLCKDNSYTSNATKKGACGGHKGVKTWYATATSTAPATPGAPTSAPTSKPAFSAKPTAAATPAAGDVWVNTSSKTYHCAGTKWYGKTKQGEYMSESAAKAAGNHADHGKACS